MVDAAPERVALEAADGHRFETAHYASADPSAPALLFFPAMGTRASFYRGFGAALARAGVHFFVADWRGIASSNRRASRRADFGYRHLVELDMPAAVAAARARLPASRLFLGGHSLGGQLSALCAAQSPDEIAGLVLIASGSVYHRAWTGRHGPAIYAFAQSTVLISALVGYFPGKRFRFGGREAFGVMRDWARVARHGRYLVSGSTVDYEARLAELEKPVLALGFSGDGFAPCAATEFLIAKLARCERTHHRWPDADHAERFDHFSWARQPEAVAHAVVKWIAA